LPEAIYYYIIRFIWAVQYNPDKNSWTGFLTDIYKAKKEIIDISSDTDTFFTKYRNSKEYLSETISILSNQENGLNNFIAQQNLADESLIAFLRDANYGTKDLAAYQQYLRDTGNATSTFAALTSKAGTILKYLGASTTSIGINLGISAIIGLVIKLLDMCCGRAFL